MDPDLMLRVFTLLVYLGALASQVLAVMADPKEQRVERGWYNLITTSWILHVIVFYIMVILRRGWISELSTWINFGSWSNAIRIHVGISVVIKEIVHISWVKGKADNDDD